MSTMYVTEYADPGSYSSTFLAEPAVADQKITFTGTAGTSAAFAGNTAIVRIQVDGIASILFGTAPTATTSYRRMTAGQTEYFRVPAGQSYKVSAITTT